MAITNYPVIINGTYDVYSVDYVSDSATPLELKASSDFTVNNKLGCLQEGFTLNWSFNVKDVQTECLGETVIDGINLGVGTATVSGVFQEWNQSVLTGGVRGNIENTIWPEGEFGELSGISKQCLFSRLTTPLAAVPRTGTPAATDNHIFYFFATYPDPGSDFSANFNFEEQIVPFTFKCYPVPVNITSETVRILLPDMDQTQITLADYTMRFWKQVDVV